MIFRLSISVVLAAANAAFACEETGTAMQSEASDAPVAIISIEPPPLSQPFSFVITVCTDKPVTDVTIDATMPAHQHGMNYEPRTTQSDGNTLQVDDMVFHMPGFWEIELNAVIDDIPVSYTHPLTL